MVESIIQDLIQQAPSLVVLAYLSYQNQRITQLVLTTGYSSLGENTKALHELTVLLDVQGRAEEIVARTKHD